MGETTLLLTIVCWLWKGWHPVYLAEHVNVLERMLQRYLTIPHRLVCVTDMPAGVSCETYPLWEKPQVKIKHGSPNCYRRLFLFSREACEIFGDRVLSIDLDCVILSDISSLITEDDFRICYGTSSPYNGSMWLHKTGTRSQVWDDFDPAISPGLPKKLLNEKGKPYYGSDQSWLAYKIPGEKVWNKSDGVYAYSRDIRHKPRPDNIKIIFFPGGLKPWMMKYYDKEIYREYQQYMECI